MAENQIRKLSHKHQAILMFMLEHPEMKLGLVAKHFEVSQPWLSVVVNSDAFQAQLAYHQEEMFSDIRTDLRAKFRGMANMAADNLLKHVDDMGVRELQTTAELALKACGFTADTSNARDGGGNHNVVNVINLPAGVTREQLSGARALIGSAPQQRIGHTIEGTPESIERDG